MTEPAPIAHSRPEPTRPNWRTTLPAGLLFGVAYVPLLLLSLHNHPSAADDYCFADTARRYGFWQAQVYYYNGWTGRYFSNMLVHGTPLVWGWYDGFRLIPALAVTGLVGALYALVGELLRSEPLRTRLSATGLLFFLFVLALPSPVEAFFWTAAVASYTVPTALTLYLLAVILRWYDLRPGVLKSLTSVWAAVLVFAIVGSGETNLIVLVALLGSGAAYRLLFERRFDTFLAFLVLVALVCSWLVFRAPGNAIRLGSNQQAGSIVASLLVTLRTVGGAVLRWLWQTPLLPLSLLYVPVAVRLNRRAAGGRWLRVPVWVLTGWLAGLLIVLAFPSAYGLGVPPPRVMNVAYGVFVLGWFYVLTGFVGAYRQRTGPVARWLANGARVPGVAVVVAGVWIVAGTVISPTLRQLYNDLWSGHAATYDREMTARHRQLISPADTLRLVPISVYPPSLFVEDIQHDRNHWWNRCQAGYYNHKALILK